MNGAKNKDMQHAKAGAKRITLANKRRKRQSRNDDGPGSQARPATKTLIPPTAAR
jgi:hypothetical protein